MLSQSVKSTIEIRNRWSGQIQFTAEIESSHDASEGMRLGAAIKAAYASRADLSRADLRGADLRGANLNDAVMRGADLRGANLNDAVMRGANLSGADLNDAVMRGANLNDAVMRGANLSRADLRGADLNDAVMRGANLNDAVMRGADLRGADLSRADLRGADLNDILEKEVPLVPDIDAKILAAIEENKIKGTNGLDMRQWHGTGDNSVDETNWCRTTHCRAGYAICIAGKEGFVLERKYGAAMAGMLLYLKSDPGRPIPDFYCTNEEAMRDMRIRAGFEKLGAP